MSRSPFLLLRLIFFLHCFLSTHFHSCLHSLPIILNLTYCFHYTRGKGFQVLLFGLCAIIIPIPREQKGGIALEIMGNETPDSCSMNPPQGASNYDEIFTQQRLHFADSLKDLKNLRKQLYSAAEYFEVSYDKDDHKQFVVETSKDYATKALISAVDHLGSMADKLGQFLDEKAIELSETKLRFSCIEQRLKTYQGFIDLSGLSQQSLIIKTPKHHKHYIIPDFICSMATFSHSAGEILHGGVSKSIYRDCISCSGEWDDLHQPKRATFLADNVFAKAFQAATQKPHPQFSRKGHSRQPSTESSPSSLTFSFTRIESIKTGKRSVSPLRFTFNRSRSITSRSSSPSSRTNKQRCPSEPRRAISMCIKPEINGGREIDQYSRKSKHLFKALLSIHRSRKEAVPNKYRDDRL